MLRNHDPDRSAVRDSDLPLSEMLFLCTEELLMLIVNWKREQHLQLRYRLFTRIKSKRDVL